MKNFIVAFIGHGKQAKKIEKIVNKNLSISQTIIFNPKYKKNSLSRLTFTNKFEEIIKSDVIFITSPNNTHFSYLEKLHKYKFKKYIFCEKPLCENINELNRLKLLFKDFKRLYVNFNYRFSPISEVISEAKKNKYGEVIKINFNNSHGLAFNKSFKKTWRNSHDKNFMLVNKAIHIIDLLIYSFEIPITFEYSVLNYAKKSKFLDTLKLNLNFKKFISSTIFCSYAAPFQFNFDLITSNAIFKFEFNKILIFYPRDTFNKTGQFKTPTCYKIKKYKSFEHDSLNSSIKFFCDNLKKNENIKKNIINSYLKTHEFIFKNF